MEAASGSFVVLTRESGEFPPELCPMLAPTENPDAGDRDQVLPTP
jgi:hypothetical protein